MRRRRDPNEPVLPDRLRRFVADEWPGDVYAAREAWPKARLAYAEVNRGGPLGTPLDVLRAEVRDDTRP